MSSESYGKVEGAGPIVTCIEGNFYGQLDEYQK